MLVTIFLLFKKKTQAKRKGEACWWQRLLGTSCVNPQIPGQTYPQYSDGCSRFSRNLSALFIAWIFEAKELQAYSGTCSCKDSTHHHQCSMSGRSRLSRTALLKDMNGALTTSYRIVGSHSLRFGPDDRDKERVERT